MAKQGPAFKCKAKAKDGSKFQVTTRDGERISVGMTDVFVVWDNDGRLSLKFASPELEAAVCKALGKPAGGCYFNLYDNRRDEAARAIAEADANDDF